MVYLDSGLKDFGLTIQMKKYSSKRIQSLFVGTKFLTRKDGSLEEAFPNEGSYCVTALVAFDLLVTIDLLAEKISDLQRKEFIEIVSH